MFMRSRLRLFTGLLLLLLLATSFYPAAAAEGAAVTLATELVASGLTKPIFLTSAPGDSARLFVVEQGGYIRIIRNGSVLPTPFLNISDSLSPGFERGLLCLAFHPAFPDSNYFYVNYTNQAGNLVLARFEVSPGADTATLASMQKLLTITEPESNHNGGTVFFGSNDGYLYLSVGDGGGGGDQHGSIGNGQDINVLLGKLLRLDINHGLPYTIPPDNPFVGQAGLDEIWAYGLRNPFRVGLDIANGDLYIADVGQSSWEELNYQPGTSTGGENYGWRLMEGAHCYNPSSGCDPGGLTYPLTEYSSSIGCSIIGGYVYRGCRIPELQGTFFYADWCSGRIWSFVNASGSVTDSVERTAELDPPGSPAISSPASFGLDAKGEIYILDHTDGEVYKIVPADESLLDCTQAGCCSNPGDANRDGAVNVGDAVYLISYAFRGGLAPPCLDEGDANADCAVNVGDAVFIINFAFRGGAVPVCPQC